ncbi:MAG TPA: glycosyltransferase family 4 protein [Longimicrobium sp.]|nr:glycosyltransferase family 4 protein [Longimicrobium sp.]
MADILIVLPYSGTGFGGGLAVLNQKLTRALAQQGHKVRLLTMQLPEKISANPDEHWPAQIITIQNKETAGMVGAGGADGEKQRDRLYELFNMEETLLSSYDIGNKPILDAIRCDGFEPGIIIGHSRFSGPAALLLKQRVFQRAKVEYFLHSFPVEGSALTGYEAYEMKVDAELAKQKFEMEKKWMPRADVVVAMGPLIRAGAMLILGEATVKGARVHEAIPGIELTRQEPVTYAPRKVPRLLFCGRASAPIKGLEDLLLAVRMLYDSGVPVEVDVLWWEQVTYGNDRKASGQDPRVVDVAAAQKWVDEMLNIKNKKQELRVVTVLGKARTSEEVVNAYRTHDAVLMPSYIEHFGLVPFEAAGHEVPVLVNKVSGSGMFLADRSRFGEVGEMCVVKDFGGSMQDPRDFLVNVKPDAFDQRPAAWAFAIQALVKDLPGRFRNAVALRDMLANYTYDHFAAAVVAVADAKWNGKNTYQGPGGQVVEAGR